MLIIPIYASLLAFFFVFLSVRTIRTRRRYQTSLGDAGKPELARAIGVHANFAEYTPLVLILLYFVEIHGAPNWAMHFWGSAFCVGRLSHAYGVSQLNENFRFRIAGMMLTFMTITTSAVALLVLRFLGGAGN